METIFGEFYNRQTQKVKLKINWTIGLVKDLKIVREQYLKHIEGTDLYEIRVIFGSNIFRIFCFFDKGLRCITERVSKKDPENSKE